MDSPGSGCLGNTLISLLGHMSISDTLRSHEYLLQSLALKFEKSLFQDPTTSDQSFFFSFFLNFVPPFVITWSCQMPLTFYGLCSPHHSESLPVWKLNCKLVFYPISHNAVCIYVWQLFVPCNVLSLSTADLQYLVGKLTRKMHLSIK